ncbi:hypothetical protein C0J52_10240 [Blattella germanica]|nr:hypothetical protein C0J52_10240 [Blattella germanica]
MNGHLISCPNSHNFRIIICFCQSIEQQVIHVSLSSIMKVDLLPNSIFIYVVLYIHQQLQNFNTNNCHNPFSCLIDLAPLWAVMSRCRVL